jgi:nitronate monooxygenase
MSAVLAGLPVPIVQAPMAGGPSTPELAVAVDRGGGFGFLAAGYLTPERLRDDIAALGSRVERFGVNVFAPSPGPADRSAVEEYARLIEPEGVRAGVELGPLRFDDDYFEEKIDLLTERSVAVVSFTFGLPPTWAVERLRAAGSEVWLTVTSVPEAAAAQSLGGQALIVQGVEAGGHRAIFTDDDAASDLTLLAALQLVGAAVDLPMIGAGSIMTGAALAAVLVAGARAGQVGTAYLLSPEAGTSAAQRTATESATATVLTRAFSGRQARSVRNRFHDDYGASAPHGYPEIHHLTAPLRARGRAAGDSGVINLWAGQAHELAKSEPAENITRRLAEEARAAIARWADRP